jgi:hypothetical protein
MRLKCRDITDKSFKTDLVKKNRNRDRQKKIHPFLQTVTQIESSRIRQWVMISTELKKKLRAQKKTMGAIKAAKAIIHELEYKRLRHEIKLRYAIGILHQKRKKMGRVQIQLYRILWNTQVIKVALRGIGAKKDTYHNY